MHSRITHAGWNITIALQLFYRQDVKIAYILEYVHINMVMECLFKNKLMLYMPSKATDYMAMRLLINGIHCKNVYSSKQPTSALTLLHFRFVNQMNLMLC